MSFDKKYLNLLYDRPLEPLFTPKGEAKDRFEVPLSLLTNRYKTIIPFLVHDFPDFDDMGEFIYLKEISPPDLSEILILKRDENFSVFFPKHRKAATTLINLFMDAKNVEDFLHLAAYCRDRVNSYLFIYCLSVAILHRDDTEDLNIPTLLMNFPDKYVDSQLFGKASEEVVLVLPGSRNPIEVPVDSTASNLEVEHRLVYFTEDVGVNLQYWNWHLVYPVSGRKEIVAKDRRGELFYYFHHQIMARYNMERMCNSLPRVKKFSNWREVIPEGYYPKLNSFVSNRPYPGRPIGMALQNVNREQDELKIDIEDMETLMNRILEAIHSGFYLDANGKKQQLTEIEGIDVLGNIIEASTLSPNRNYYGEIHNLILTMLSFVHDPDLRHMESFGVIGDPATAMRDPIFYGLHAYLNDIFLKYKATLPRYIAEQLDYDGVKITDLTIRSQDTDTNILNTFWQQSDVDMSGGLTLHPRGSVFFRFTHLQHQPFNYTITVKNDGGKKEGTCRIFLGPKFDEKGNPWLFQDQKDLMVEMDRFIVTLEPGMNVITQSSSESAVAIPAERALHKTTEGTGLEQLNVYGCGWPQHMLVPKGTPEGYPCQLFVMISNYTFDMIKQSTKGHCGDSSIYCGIRDKLYPDRRSMGYPFDRMPRDGVDTLEQFLTPNMQVKDITIRFSNRTVPPKVRM